MSESQRRCSLPDSGYHGQQYEVRALDENRIEFVVGWTDDPNGAPLVGMVQKHPSWSSARVLECRQRRRKEPPKKEE